MCLFTLPYIYEISGADNQLFLLYLEKYMEEGDALELLHIPNQHDFDFYLEKITYNPEPTVINIKNLTYQDKYGTYQFDSEKWLEELSHKNYLKEDGITTLVKYY